MRKRFYLLPVFIAVFIALFYSTYREVQRKTLIDYTNRQMILVRQAARGIENFFSYYQRELQFLGGLEAIVTNNKQGQALLDSFYLNNKQEIRALTRVNAKGTLIYTTPSQPDAIGSNLSSQAHVQKLLKERRPVVSDVFTAVQGYQAVAFHVPLFDGQRFAGSLAVLIPFDDLAEVHLNDMAFGDDGYAWMISEQGVELYSPMPDHVGRSVFENAAEWPGILAVSRRMIAGESGFDRYRYLRMTGKGREVIHKHVVFCPVSLGNTFWSIAMASPETLVYSAMQGFQKRLIFLALMLSLVAAIYLFTFFKTRAILNESRKREVAESALSISENRFRSYIEYAPYGVFVTDHEGRYVEVNPAAEIMAGYSAKELQGMAITEMNVPEELEAAEAHFNQLVQEGYASGDFHFIPKAGNRRIWTVTAVKLSDTRFIGFANDITDRKQAEDQIKHNLKEKEVLLKEIHHRVKNNLNVISSLLSLQAAELESDQGAVAALNESMYRVQSMAFVHQQLYQSTDFSKIGFKTYIENLIEHLILIYSDRAQITASRNLDNIDLNIQLAVPCGLLLNELVTNVFKHAFPGGRQGHFWITLKQIQPGVCRIEVGDDGVGMPVGLPVEKMDSLGLKLVHILAQQINAELQFRCENGTMVQVTFPLDPLAVA